MNKKEILIQLEALVKESNPFDESYVDLSKIHIKADNLLLKHIDDKEITKLFKKIKKWYA